MSNANDTMQLKHLELAVQRVNADYTQKIGAVAEDTAKAFKSGKVEGNTVKLFTSADQTGEAAFSFDFPAELFLDQAKTGFVPEFAFSAETYPGAEDPGLDGKPVMVLAVKDKEGEAETVTYSFLDMTKLVDTYKAKAGDGSATVTVDGYEISVNVNISEKEGNALQKDENGALYVAPVKVADATDGNLVGMDADGNLTDSGVAANKVATKVEGATAGNIATLDENGNLVDSGITFATDEAVAAMLDRVIPAE